MLLVDTLTIAAGAFGSLNNPMTTIAITADDLND